MIPDNPHQDTRVETPNPEFARDFEQVIKSFAEATEAGKTQEAMEAALSAFMMAAAEAAQNPTPDLQAAEEANECENCGD